MAWMDVTDSPEKVAGPRRPVRDAGVTQQVAECRTDAAADEQYRD
jgi:hypothetical protein